MYVLKECLIHLIFIKRKIITENDFFDLIVDIKNNCLIENEAYDLLFVGCFFLRFSFKI